MQNARYFVDYSTIKAVSTKRKMQDAYLLEMAQYDPRYKGLRRLSSCCPYGHLAMIAYVQATEEAICLALQGLFKEAQEVVDNCYQSNNIYWHNGVLDRIESGRLLPM